MPPSTRSISQLIGDVKLETGTIVSDIKTLAKAETSESAKRAGIGVGLFIAALGLAWFALVALTIAFGFGLVAAGLPIWAAFLIVFGVFVLLAAGLVFIGVANFKKVKAPERTIAAVKGTMAALSGSAAGASDAAADAVSSLSFAPQPSESTPTDKA